MTPDHKQDNWLTDIYEMLEQQPDGMRQVLENLFNAIMKAERSQAIGAAPYERSDNRKGHANGYKPKIWNTRMGSLDLKIPTVRDMEFYPRSLEKGCRSERALKAAVAEM